MPKIVDLNTITDRVKANTVSTTPDYYLFMLGTDTVFTPEPTINSLVLNEKKTYENGETLSYMARLVADRLNEPAITAKDQPVSFASDSVTVINGPTTLGKEVGERVAEGVLQCLMAIASGKKSIEIMAHSRGAVESILIAHELERIKNGLNSPKSFKQLLLETPCTYTKAAFNAVSDSISAENELIELGNRLATIPINLFLMDPVPGDGLKPIDWDDPRFYKPLPCQSLSLILFRDERTRLFIPIVPNGANPLILPGHHGTASGNLYGQQYDLLPESIINRDTSTVQKLVIAKLLYFIDSKTTLLKNNKEPLDLNHDILDRISNQFIEIPDENEPNKHQLLLHLYEDVLKNDEAFQYYAKNTSYPVLGRLYTASGARYIHYGACNYIGLDTITPSMDNKFVNTEHAVFFLHETLDFRLDNTNTNPVPLVAQMTNSLKNLLKRYLSGDEQAKGLLEKKEDRNVTFQNAISVFVNAVSQKVLRNNLTTQEKTNLMEQIRGLFAVLDELKQKGISNSTFTPILDELLTILKTGILNTTVGYYNSLLDQMDFINTLVKNYQRNENKDLPSISYQDLLIDLEGLYETTKSLIDGKAGIQKLVDGNNLDVIEVDVMERRMDQLEKHAAIILKDNHVDLSKKPDEMSEEFFAKVKPLAIAYGAVDPELRSLKNTVKKVKEQRQKLLSPHETRCANLIYDELIPLARDYLKYLTSEAKAVNPTIDEQVDLPQVDLTNPVFEEYHKIYIKFNFVKNVLSILENTKTNPIPSVRILKFAEELQRVRNEPDFTAHRDPTWQQWLHTSLYLIAVICSGIIPGIAVLVCYSRYTGKSPLFFTQSRAEQFIDQANSSLLAVKM